MQTEWIKLLNYLQNTREIDSGSCSFKQIHIIQISPIHRCLASWKKVTINPKVNQDDAPVLRFHKIWLVLLVDSVHYSFQATFACHLDVRPLKWRHHLKQPLVPRVRVSPYQGKANWISAFPFPSPSSSAVQT